MKYFAPSPRLTRARVAFTLMEMLLVLAIIGLLIGASSVGFKSVMENGKRTATETKLGKLRAQIMLYNSRHTGKYPSNAVGLRALVNEKLVDSEDELTDAWGQPFVYAYPNKRSTEAYDVFSKGTDLEDPNDDIGNFSTSTGG
jgi:general secretion pathway protein G